MINFLPNIIKTFSDRSQQTVGSLIKSIKADKGQVAELVKNLSNFSAGADFAPALSSSRSIIESEFFVDIFRDIQLRFDSYFRASNAVSVSVNSMIDLMLSQIAKTEKNINYLENYIENFEFISGNDDLYNFSYIENFDNFLNSNQNDSEPVPYVDRGGSEFGEFGNGYIDPVVSKFKIGNGIEFINPIGYIKSVDYESNYPQYISSITDYKALFNEKQSNVWSVSIKSPTVLTSNPANILRYVDYDFSYLVGAKTIIAVEFIKEIEMDVIRFNPNEFNGLQLMQVVIESSNNVEKSFSINSNVPISGYQMKKILSAPIEVESVVDINFPLDKVKKVIFVFNQSTYTKTSNTASPDEMASRIVSKIINEIRQKRKANYSSLQDIILEFFKKGISIDEAKRNTYSYTDYYSSKYPQSPSASISGSSLIGPKIDSESTLDEHDELMKQNQLTSIVKNIVSQALGARFNLFKDSLYVNNNYTNFGGGLGKISGSAHRLSKNSSLNAERFSFEETEKIPGSSFSRSPILTQNLNATSSTYDYSFSIKNIQFGKTNQIQNSTNSFSSGKACFISSKIPVLGEPLAIKAKLNLEKSEQYKNLPKFDLDQANSYELSISIKDQPKSELDWIPIISYDSSKIDSEMLFVDPITKIAILRFYPKETSLSVYRNQNKISDNEYVLNKFEKSITIKNYDQKSIYIVSYTADDINYSQNFIDISTLKTDTYSNSAFSNDINGEYFERTGSNNSVKLSQSPYIDNNKLKNATYSNTLGTINSVDYIGYNPVSVKLANGSTAINLTNYVLGRFDRAEFYSTSEFLFYQNGRHIVFNRAVNEPFTISYNYLNSYIRFRLIVRNNFNSYFSTGSVDSVILKLKTKNSDNFSSKLLRLG